MLVMRPTYYQDVSMHRQNIAKLLSELDAKNRKGLEPRAVEQLISDNGERNDTSTIGVKSSFLATCEKQIAASVKPKPSGVIGYVDL